MYCGFASQDSPLRSSPESPRYEIDVKYFRTKVLLTSAALSCAPAWSADAQVTTPRRPRNQATDTLDRNPRSADSIPVLPTVLDRPIDRNDYDLGPGDVLEISLFGEVNDQLTVTVGPEGTAVIPKIGIARLLGANLDQAEAQVRSLVSELYRRVDVRVNLARVRTFKVFVLGNVEEPGVRIATAATRVSEVAPQAPGSRVYYRNLLVRRANGDSIHVDLVRFFQTGDLSVNPTLRGGDAVVVPLIDRTVNVYGRVVFPGMYQFRANESLADFLRVVNGGTDFPANAADSVQLTRFTSAGARDFMKLARSDAVGARGREMILQPFDAVYVPEISNYKEQKVASVVGQVRRPGTYPIRPETTTVRELVEMAGGLTPEAALTAATLRRAIWLVAGTSDRPNDLDSLFANDERYRRRTTVEIQDSAFVSIEFEKLFAEGKDVSTARLRDGDRLVVPWRESQVTVFGAVSRPGILAFEPGHTLDDYIRAAGGFSQRASKKDVSLIKRGTGTRIASGDVSRIDPGDQIVVPFGTRTTFLQRVQTIGTVMGIVANSVLTIYTIRSIIKG
jgi:protein involved in polysaccharide export with SLBB domain